jgi:PAS domain-containing protein/HPt (histidine-containing phosphotransfer) domain-containing protein
MVNPGHLHRRRRAVLLLFVACLAWVLLCPHAEAAPRPTRHVLVLNAYHPTYGWTANIVAGVRAELDALEDVDLSIEFMDTKKIYTPEYAASLAALFAQKYAKIRFDLIISSDDDALNFLLEYRDRLFAGVPAVFCGVNNYRDGRLGGHTGFTGVNEENDLDRSFELIAEQLPGTKRIVLLADKTATGVVWQNTLAARKPKWDQRFTFTTITDVTTDELSAELRALPRDAVVLWGAFMRDRADTPLSFSQSLRLVVEAAPVPVYGFMDITVSEGAVGGFVVSGFAQGQTAARLGKRILAGESVDRVPVVRESPNVYMFDHEAMRRFHIEGVPPGAIVKNRPFSFYEAYRTYVWAALAGMGTETIAILALLGILRAATRNSRAKLRESEQRYRSIVDDGTDYIGRFDPQGAVVFANDALSKLGDGALTLEGGLAEGFAALRPEAPVISIEQRSAPPGGEARWIHWTVRGFFSEQGALTEVQAVGRDTTEQRAAMEKIERAKASMQGVLDGMRDGLLVCDRRGAVTEVRSRAAVTWFGEPAEGVLLWDHLCPDDAEQRVTLEVAYEQLADDLLPFEVAAAQMPSILHRGGKTFRVSCEPLTQAGELEAVIVVLADVTTQIRQEAAALRGRELPAIVGNLLRDRAGFHGFIREAEELLRTLAASADRKEVLRLLHTLKGNTAIYGFTRFASACHELETLAAADPDEPSPASVAALARAWREAREGIAVFLAEGEGREVRVQRDELDDLERRLDAHQDHAAILRAVRRWENPSMAEVLGIYPPTAKQLATRFGKEVEVDVKDNHLRLPRGEFRAFLGTLVHVLRNAVDHGIEEPAARELAGKSRAGHATIESRFEGTQLVIGVEDDGRGIDWAAVRARAAAAGLPASTDEELVEALFHDGLSTKDLVTEVSGRGVGLAAVRERCRDLGGIVVRSTEGAGTRFEFRFPVPSLAPPRAA